MIDRASRFLALPVFCSLFLLTSVAPAQPGQFPMTSTPDNAEGKVTLAWTPPAGTVDRYYITRYATTLGNVIPDSTAFSIIDSVPGIIHQYTDTPPISQSFNYFVYRVYARMIPPGYLRSEYGLAYFIPRTPPPATKLYAGVSPPDSVYMHWDRPLNSNVVKSYILAAFTTNPLPIFGPEGLQLIDSSVVNNYAFKAPSGTLNALVTVLVRTTEGFLVPSNTVPLQFPGATPEPPRLSGEVTPDDSVRLAIYRPLILAGKKAFIYRYPIDTPSVLAFTFPWVLIDSTTEQTFVDFPPGGHLGYAYLARFHVGPHSMDTKPFLAFLEQRLYLRVFPDIDGSIRLTWTPALRREPAGFVVWKKVLRDSTLAFTDSGGVAVDTVRGTEWKEMPRETDAFGFAYKVSALGVGETVESPWHAIRVHRPAVQPFLLGVRFDIQRNVKLYWTAPFQTPPDKFYILRASMPRNTNALDTSSIAIIDSVAGNVHEYTDAPPHDSSNAFAYIVFAANAEGVFARTNHVAVLFGDVRADRDLVRITTEPIRFGEAGEAYAYDADATSSQPTAVLRWRLLHGPEGMSVDSVTGIVSWLPASRGLYRVGLAVGSSFGGLAVQEYALAIAEGTGSVAGMVYDENGQPLPRVVVRLFKRDTATPFEYVRITDSAGAYEFAKVEVGSYVAMAMDLTGQHRTEWWFDHRSPEDADPVIVADSVTTDVSFMLESRIPNGTPFTVQGTVTDTTGAPIADGVVVLARAEFMLNSAKHLGAGSERGENLRDLLGQPDSAGLDLLSPAAVGPIVIATTSLSGGYSAEVGPGAYIAFAYAPGYRKTFYDNKAGLLRANILRVHSDTSGIDFMLRSLPDVPLASLSGGVYDTSGLVGVASRVVAFRFTGDARSIDSYFTDADESGAYTLSDLPPGEYLVLALPLGHFAPSFYSVGGPTLRWNQATKVTVDGTSISGIDIFVKPLSQTFAGFTSVAGRVETNESGGFERTLKRTVATGVDGSLVYATAPDGSVVGYAVTDETGAYSIPDLAPGVYTITTDQFGYNEPTDTEAEPTYDENGDPAPAEVNFNVSYQVTAVEDEQSEVPTEYSLGQNYPNPFNPTTRFNFALPKESHVTVEVYNLLGQRIAVLADGLLPAGTHTAVWNGRTLSGSAAATGVYFYTLRSGNVNMTKRMVLLK